MPETTASFDNPFATRWISPCALPFLFPPGNDVGQLMTRLEQFGWRAAIVGPHGCGKSTLLATLIPRLKKANREVVCITLREGEYSVARIAVNQAARSPRGVLVIDGWDQLRSWTRWRIRRRFVRFDRGLLVTSHTQSRLSTLIQLKPSLAIAKEVVARLIAGRDLAIPKDVIIASFQANGDNVREMLFDLYNWYEHNQRQNRSNL